MRRLTHRFISALGLPVAVFLSLSSLMAKAEEEGVAFEQPQDVILHWAERACLLLFVASVIVVGYVLLFRRDRLMTGGSKWLLFMGLCVLPLPAAFLSTGVGMEESKTVEFCYQCHAPMDPFVHDMMDPASEHLAAVHYKNKLIQSEHCWNCHSDYGISGTAEAKMTGMKHIYYYTLDSWEAPVELYTPYKWSICLDCHEGAGYFNAPREDETAHEGVLELVKSGEFGCTDCHNSAHPPREERSTKP